MHPPHYPSRSKTTQQCFIIIIIHQGCGQERKSRTIQRQGWSCIQHSIQATPEWWGGDKKHSPNTSWGARYKKIQYIFWPYMKYLYLLISSQYSIFKLFPCLPLLLQICADGIRFYSKKQQTPADSLEIIQYTDMLKWWMDGYVRDGDKKCIKNWSWYVFSLSPRATLTTPVQIATRHLIWMWRRVKRRSCSRMEKPAT